IDAGAGRGRRPGGAPVPFPPLRRLRLRGVPPDAPLGVPPDRRLRPGVSARLLRGRRPLLRPSGTWAPDRLRAPVQGPPRPVGLQQPPGGGAESLRQPADSPRPVAGAPGREALVRRSTLRSPRRA